MSATNEEKIKIPCGIIINIKDSCLQFIFSEERIDSLSFEFMRVHSPSAEVVGHGKGQEILQVGKRCVQISALEPIGNYGVKPIFSDGHDTGIYSWSYLNWLLDNKQLLWDKYLLKIQNTGASRN